VGERPVGEPPVGEPPDLLPHQRQKGQHQIPMDKKTNRLLLRGIDGLVWVQSRLSEVERRQGASPDILRMQRDCTSLRRRLAGELQRAEDPEGNWQAMWPLLLSGQDLAFLRSLSDFLAHDAKGGGGHLWALLELERFISQVEWT